MTIGYDFGDEWVSEKSKELLTVPMGDTWHQETSLDVQESCTWECSRRTQKMYRILFLNRGIMGTQKLLN